MHIIEDHKDYAKISARIRGSVWRGCLVLKAHTHTPILAHNRPILTYNLPIIVVEPADYSADSY